jgi:hypothetical protein
MEQAAIVGYALDIHADPRIGGFTPYRTKQIWGKLYIIPNDLNELLRQYHRNFETKPGD